MKEGRTLSAIATEIERQMKSKKDFMVPTPELIVKPAATRGGPAIVQLADQGDMPVRPLALNQMGERTGIPAKYVLKMQEEAPELLATNLNHWFRAKPERRMVRTLDGEVRAFLSDKFKRTDNFNVAETCLPMLQEIDGLEIRSAEITENRLYIKATSTQITARVDSVRGRHVGDIVEAGVMISNSEVGLGAVHVTPYTLFLACLNGMVREGGKRWAHIGRRAEEQEGVVLQADTLLADDKAQLLVIRDTMKAALDPANFQKWVAKVQGTTQDMLGADLGKVVEVLADTFTLNDTERQGVLRHLAAGGDLSRYGLVNAVTRLAEDADTYDRATELETLGGRIIDLPREQWSPIAQAA